MRPEFFARLRESRRAGAGAVQRDQSGRGHRVRGGAPGYTERDGSPRWYGGGRLAAGLTLPQLRRNWDRDSAGTDPRAGSFRLTGPEREQFYLHAARQADAAAEQIRRSAESDPAAAADTAWAAAATFHATARAIGDLALRDVADAYDRAARMAYGKIPQRTAEGDRLRAAARLLAMAGGPDDGSTPGSGPADRGPDAVGQGGGRAAPGRAARRAGRSGTAGRGAPLREPQPGEGGAPVPSGPQQPQPSRVPGGHETSPAWTSRPYCGPASPPPEPDNSLTESRPQSSPGPVRSPPSRAGPGR